MIKKIILIGLTITILSLNITMINISADETNDYDKFIGLWKLDRFPEINGTSTYRFFSNGSFEVLSTEYRIENILGRYYKGNWRVENGKLITEYKIDSSICTSIKKYYFSDNYQELTLVESNDIVLKKADNEKDITGWIYGRVQDKNNNPVEGLNINILLDSEENINNSIYATKTDENGYYNISVQVGKYYVTSANSSYSVFKKFSNSFFSRGYVGEGTVIEVKTKKSIEVNFKESLVKPFQIPEPSYYNVSGKVFSESSDNIKQTISNAMIKVYSSFTPWSELLKCIYTDENGNYRISLQTGHYKFQISAKNHQTCRPIEIKITKDTEINFNLTPKLNPDDGNIHGTVYRIKENVDLSKIDNTSKIYNMSKTPLKSAVITFSSIPGYNNITKRYTIYTNENGEYFLSLRPDFYSFGTWHKNKNYSNIYPSTSPLHQSCPIIIEENQETKFDIFLYNKPSPTIDIIKFEELGGKIKITKESENKYNHTIEIVNDSMKIDPIEISSDKLSIKVNGDENATGKTMVIDIDENVFDVNSKIKIKYDGQKINRAKNITDIQNPNDDGSNPEYFIIKDKNGMHILVSIPHFSEHEITIYSIVEAIGGITALIIYIGVFSTLGIMYIAPFFLVRKSK